MNYYQGPVPPLTDEEKKLRDAVIRKVTEDQAEAIVEGVLDDYDRLLGKYNAAVAAGDAMDDALGQLITQARAHRIPDHPVIDSAERALKTWRSAR